MKAGHETAADGRGREAAGAPHESFGTLCQWAGSLAALVAVTVVCRALRGTLDQAQVVLLYLLVVLGGSARGGRALGLTLAALCFGLIDYFFQAPFDTLAVGKGLDWVALLAFLTTAVVATNLLARARAEAAEAERRTDEARALARLGAETLRFGSPVETLATIEALIRRRLGVAGCTLRGWRPGARIDPDVPPLGAAVASEALAAAAERGRALVVRADGAREWLPTAPLDALAADALASTVALVLPLRVEARVVGVLAVADHQPIALGAEQRRFLTALAYFAAVAIERRDLAVAAAHAAAAQEASRLKDRVLASVSHDLRTPLTTIKALAQSAAFEGNAVGAVIEEQADRLARLVSDVLELSRLRAHDLPLDVQLNTADDLVGAAVRQTQGIVGDRRLVTEIDFTRAALVGRFDFVHALRVVGNLVENALRYTPAGGAVVIAARREGAWLAVDVADRGPGVAAAERESIFEPFYRPAGETADAGRAGLGLAIARELAEAQGGVLTYAPRRGGGSVFTLRLPAAADAGSDSPADEATADESIGHDGAGEGAPRASFVDS